MNTFMSQLKRARHKNKTKLYGEMKQKTFDKNQREK